MSVVAIVPARATDLERKVNPLTVLGGKQLLAYPIEAAMDSPSVNRVVVSTDSPEIREAAIELGAEAPFLRPVELAAPDVSLDRVLQHAIEALESAGSQLAVALLLEVAHPLRPIGLVELVLEKLTSERLDTVFAVAEERSTLWEIDEYGGFYRVQGSEGQTRQTRQVLYRELSGLACATRVEFLREGRRIGPNVGVVVVRDLAVLLDVQTDEGLALVRHLLG